MEKLLKNLQLKGQYWARNHRRRKTQLESSLGDDDEIDSSVVPEGET